MKKSIKFLSLAIVITFLILTIGCSKGTEKTGKKEAKKSEAGFTLSSSAFEDGGEIPVKYAYTDVSGGKNVSIPLEWKNLPKGTKSVAITMVDNNADKFLHWLVINIDPADTKIEEGASGKSMPSFATEFKNGFGKDGYGGPAPPAGQEHEYEITVWALDIPSMGMTENSGLKEFESFVKGKTVGKASLKAGFRL